MRDERVAPPDSPKARREFVAAGGVLVAETSTSATVEEAEAGILGDDIIRF